MKATGIVRRIDDLGRVVVPKEIRRTLRIREGDPLEIYTDREGGIILRKYSPIGELSQFSKQYAEALAQNTGYIVSITDRDRHIAHGRFGKKKRVDAERDQPSVGQSDEQRESSGCERGTKNLFRLRRMAEKIIQHRSFIRLSQREMPSEPLF